jgi:hypothetical protein
MPYVSIIILNFNGDKYLAGCLSSVLKLSYPAFEVILLDNCSTDNSFVNAKLLFSYDARIKFFSNAENFGYAEGYNRSLCFVNPKAEYLFFLNPDVVVDENCLKHLVSIAETDNSIGAVQSKLMQLTKPTIIDSLGGEVDNLGFSYLKNNGLKDKENYSLFEEIFYADGAAFLIKKKTIDEVKMGSQLFDSSFVFYCEDLDLSWRLRMKGYKLVVSNLALSFHARGGITHKDGVIPFFVFHQTKNRFAILLTNYEKLNIARNLPKLASIEICGFLFFSLNDTQRSIAILNAFCWIIKNYKYILSRRQILQKNRVVNDKTITTKMVKTRLSYLFLTA